MFSRAVSSRTLRQRSAAARQRARGDSGASIVEFAFVLPILALLVFGIIDFGTIFSDYHALRSGVRDGTRDAVVLNWGTTTSCAAQTGTSPASNIICRVKEKTGLGNTVKVGIWAPGGWQVGATLRICGQYPMKSTSGITSPFINGKAVTAKVEFRIEQPLPTGTTFTAAQEGAVTSWPSSCTTG